MSLKKDIYYNFFFGGGCQMKVKTFAQLKHLITN